MKHHNAVHIKGHVSAGFEAVRDAFTENFSLRHELGGACCVYHRGEKVVDSRNLALRNALYSIIPSQTAPNRDMQRMALRAAADAGR